MATATVNDLFPKINIVITVIGVLLAVFVNARYGALLKNAEIVMRPKKMKRK